METAEATLRTICSSVVTLEKEIFVLKRRLGHQISQNLFTMETTRELAVLPFSSLIVSFADLLCVHKQ